MLELLFTNFLHSLMGGGCYLRTFKKQQKNQIKKHVLGQMF